MSKCVICKSSADEEHPRVVYGKNPYTFRNAIMHYDCFCDAIMDIKNEPPKSSAYTKSPKYKSRLEEYTESEQGQS